MTIWTLIKVPDESESLPTPPQTPEIDPVLAQYIQGDVRSVPDALADPGNFNIQPAIDFPFETLIGLREMSPISIVRFSDENKISEIRKNYF